MSDKPKHLENVYDYFDSREWDKKSTYEKLRFKTTFDNYVELIESGFVIPKPYFMTEEKEEAFANKKNENNQTDHTSTTNKRNQKKCAQDLEKKKPPKQPKLSEPRYPKRSVPKRNYAEEEDIPDDRYIYCDECMRDYVDDCYLHEFIILPDNPVPTNPENLDRARQTVPKDLLKVATSKIPNSGDGVWALKKLQSRIRFGPYQGESKLIISADEKYSWELKEKKRVISFIDGANPAMSNWMRFVNCARTREEQNLVAFQYCGKIYYRTVREIEPNTELLVYYGSEFAKQLGIDTKHFNSPPIKPLQDNGFKCDSCNFNFASPIYLEQHSGRCIKTVSLPSTSGNINNIDGYRGKSEMNLTQHIRNRHSDNLDTRQVPCPICKKLYASKRSLFQHMKLHNPSDMRYKCPICTKSYYNKFNFNDHKRRHNGERPYKCEHCDKAFASISDYKCHVRTHTDGFHKVSAESGGLDCDKNEIKFFHSFFQQDQPNLMKHIKRKHIHFLVTIVQPSRSGLGGLGVKRRYPLLINDSRYGKTFKTDTSSDGPVIHELGQESALTDSLLLYEGPATAEIDKPAAAALNSVKVDSPPSSADPLIDSSNVLLHNLNSEMLLIPDQELEAGELAAAAAAAETDEDSEVLGLLSDSH